METTEFTQNTMPRIGDMAPDFDAVTTKGPIKFSQFARQMDCNVLTSCRFYTGMYN